MNDLKKHRTRLECLTSRETWTVLFLPLLLSVVTIILDPNQSIHHSIEKFDKSKISYDGFLIEKSLSPYELGYLRAQTILEQDNVNLVKFDVEDVNIHSIIKSIDYITNEETSLLITDLKIEKSNLNCMLNKICDDPLSNNVYPFNSDYNLFNLFDINLNQIKIDHHQYQKGYYHPQKIQIQITYSTTSLKNPPLIDLILHQSEFLLSHQRLAFILARAALSSLLSMITLIIFCIWTSNIVSYMREQKIRHGFFSLRLLLAEQISSFFVLVFLFLWQGGPDAALTLLLHHRVLPNLVVPEALAATFKFFKAVGEQGLFFIILVLVDGLRYSTVVSSAVVHTPTAPFEPSPSSTGGFSRTSDPPLDPYWMLRSGSTNQNNNEPWWSSNKVKPQPVEGPRRELPDRGLEMRRLPVMSRRQSAKAPRGAFYSDLTSEASCLSVPTTSFNSRNPSSNKNKTDYQSVHNLHSEEFMERMKPSDVRVPSHHPCSSFSMDFLFWKSCFLIISSAVSVFSVGIRFPGFTHALQIAENELFLERLVVVLGVVMTCANLLWVSFILQAMYKTSQELKKDKYMSSRFRQMAFRLFVDQIFLGIILIGSTYIYRLYQFVTAVRKGFGHQSLTEMWANSSQKMTQHFGYWATQDPQIGEMLFVSIVCYTIVYIFSIPSVDSHPFHASSTSMDEHHKDEASLTQPHMPTPLAIYNFRDPHLLIPMESDLEYFIEERSRGLCEPAMRCSSSGRVHSHSRTSSQSLHNDQTAEHQLSNRQAGIDSPIFPPSQSPKLNRHSASSKFPSDYRRKCLSTSPSLPFCLETAAWLMECTWQAYFPPSTRITPPREGLGKESSGVPVKTAIKPPYDPIPALLGTNVEANMDLRRLGLTLNKHFHNYETDTVAYVASKRGRIVVAFRGTVGLQNMTTDLKMAQTLLPDLRNTTGYYSELLRKADSETSENVREPVKLTSNKQLEQGLDTGEACSIQCSSEMSKGGGRGSGRDESNEQPRPTSGRVVQDKSCYSETTPWTKWWKDLLSKLPLAKQVLPRVHSGFWEAYSSIREELCQALILAIKDQYLDPLRALHARLVRDSIRRNNPWAEEQEGPKGEQSLCTRLGFPETELGSDFLSSSERVKSSFLNFLDIEPIQICVCGHSLGGGLALVAALDLCLNVRPITEAILFDLGMHCDKNIITGLDSESLVEKFAPSLISYVYGTPPVGNATFASMLKRELSTCYRVEVDGDIFTQIPFFLKMYKHAGVTVLLDSEPSGGIVVNPTVVETQLLRQPYHEHSTSFHALCRYRDSLESCFDLEQLRVYKAKEFHASSSDSGAFSRGGSIEVSSLPSWFTGCS